jgi:hypothetical protein
MKKLLTLIIATTLFSCNNPMSKVYTEDGFMLDLVEIRESEGDETSEKLATYVVQQAMKSAFNKDAVNMLGGKTYQELLTQADDLAAEMKAKEEEEKRLAELELRKRNELTLKISESVTFALTKKGFTEISYSDYITFTFTFKNKTSRDIDGVKGSVTFYDMFDEEIKSLNLSYDDGINAGKTVNYLASMDYNQFKDGDKRLKNTELEKMKVVWEPEQLNFSDGEKIVLE